MVVHKKIRVGKNIVNTPSYIVPLAEENLISVKVKKKAPKIEEATAETTTEATTEETQETKEESKE